MFRVFSFMTGLLLCVASSANAADDTPSAMPGDDAMTCEQIGMALMPYMNQMRGNAAELGETAREVQRRSEERMAAATAQAAAQTAAAIAASQVPVVGGVVATAQAAAQQAQMEAQMAEDKPLTDRLHAQTETLATQAEQMQSDPRFMRLMQLAEEKNCHGAQ